MERIGPFLGADISDGRLGLMGCNSVFLAADIPIGTDASNTTVHATIKLNGMCAWVKSPNSIEHIGGKGDTL